VSKIEKKSIKLDDKKLVVTCAPVEWNQPRLVVGLMRYVSSLLLPQTFQDNIGQCLYCIEILEGECLASELGAK